MLEIENIRKYLLFFSPPLSPPLLTLQNCLFFTVVYIYQITCKLFSIFFFVKLKIDKPFREGVFLVVPTRYKIVRLSQDDAKLGKRRKKKNDGDEEALLPPPKKKSRKTKWRIVEEKKLLLFWTVFLHFFFFAHCNFNGYFLAIGYS